MVFDIIEYGSDRHIALVRAVANALGAKHIKYYWLCKALSFAIDDDSNGNHITVPLLRAVRNL